MPRVRKLREDQIELDLGHVKSPPSRLFWWPSEVDRAVAALQNSTDVTIMPVEHKNYQRSSMDYQVLWITPIGATTQKDIFVVLQRALADVSIKPDNLQSAVS